MNKLEEVAKSLGIFHDEILRLRLFSYLYEDDGRVNKIPSPCKK